MTDTPLILWFRRDLRLADHPMLAAAVASGRPLIPVFLLDPETEGQGAAPKWRLGLGVEHFAARLGAMRSRLTLRRGPALDALQRLIGETGAGGVWWSRLYDPASVARDAGVKAALKAAGVEARSFAGHLLHEPWEVETGQGGAYRVFTPFWNALRGRPVPVPAAAPVALRGPTSWPASDRLADWRLGAAMNRGAAVVAAHVRVGEDKARARLVEFLDRIAPRYAETRDLPGVDGTSRLSEPLTYGEIGIREVWHAGHRAMQEGAAGAGSFLRELAWREFSYHLMHHTPQITQANWKPEWDDFPWAGDSPAAERWRRGMTGEPFVDAAMREMYVTGTMHNRARMIAASYLTKHLMTHWMLGQAWFADCLTDWDPAANAMGWQWVAGSGPDAAPYFRVFNPAGQAAKFDADGAYRRRFIAEGQGARAPAQARAYFEAVPRSWGLDPQAPYPAPVVDLAEGRSVALAAYGARET
ncbi:DNA photolyase family protein [Rhodobacter sp. Har01]|uniref:cryptochrome/photolyase family protein n=1 Tax=Rhodobacter sp. Har01 TaxID=2883999 RepID=UPI001D07D1BE|nr:deoxyribodipyrimidine photo-lyase [Rhodobacter sp. Har01]MCB6176674.1 DNA photolyase family protein [Rhodobacter sp. Har01]